MKSTKSLPLLIIKDEENGGEKRYINRAYVHTALQGVLIIAHNDGAMAMVIDEVARLLEELEAV